MVSINENAPDVMSPPAWTTTVNPPTSIVRASPGSWTTPPPATAPIAVLLYVRVTVPPDETMLPSSTQGNYDWYYSSAGSGAYQTMFTTDMDVHHVALNGDYDGDHASDFFFTTVRNDGAYQWWYFFYHTNPASIGSQQLAYDTTKPGQLRFADFNGDGITDVFHLVRTC